MISFVRYFDMNKVLKILKHNRSEKELKQKIDECL